MSEIIRRNAQAKSPFYVAYWPNMTSFIPNRKALEALFRYSYEQGLAMRILQMDELFHPSTLRFEEA